MCGIFCVFDATNCSPRELRKLALACAKLLRHRGPDWSGIYLFPDDPNSNKPEEFHFAPKAVASSTKQVTMHNGSERGTSTGCVNAALLHERLAIIDPESGAQPLRYFEEKEGGAQLVLTVNGEIYNHETIRGKTTNYKYQTNSDCEVILPLFMEHGAQCVTHLDGMFSFVVWDQKNRQFYAARDPLGITPLYVGWRADGGIVFSSELKALHGICERFEPFPPGHYLDSSSSSTEFQRYFNPVWLSPSFVPTEKLVLRDLRNSLEKAVAKRMMTDVPWGVLLSGGLDSSLVCSIACRLAKQKVGSAYPTIHTFSVGLEGSPDLKAAAEVAKFLGTKHHQMTFTLQEGLDALSDVIYHLETFDVTTTRASTPMFLMARMIKALGIKMVLSGEGADEALGGYLYFHKAPNKEEFHKETLRKLSKLHYYDCLRANKSMSAFGVEPRVPFLDQEFLQHVMTLDPEVKMVKLRPGDEKRGKIEKFILRKAFDTPENPYLPDEFLWRQKEQFSDGVGYGWIDILRDRAEAEVSQSQWAARSRRFPHNTPQTKEAYVYRSIFQGHFPGESARDSIPGGPSVACSTKEAIEWDEEFKKLAASVGGDNSGRAIVGVHHDAYDDVEKVVGGAANKKRKVTK